MSETTTVTYAPSTIDPGDWTPHAYFYIGASPYTAQAYGESGYGGGMPLDATTHANGGCAICGARYSHGVTLRHKRQPVLIAIGQICGAKYFGTAVHTDAMTRRGSELEDAAAASEAAIDFLADHPGLAEDLTVEHHTVNDIARKLERYGSLSTAQVELVRRIAGETRAYAQRQAERAASLADTPALDPGRFELTGVILSAKHVDNPYAPGPYGATTLKMLVELDDGNRVWGTVPRSIDDGVSQAASEGGDFWSLLIGAEVTFTATVEPSTDDPHFGFFKRPAKATVNPNDYQEGH